MKLRFLQPVLAVLIAGLFVTTSSGQVVETQNGPVEGGTAAEQIAVFKGIPYAAPPVGELRWRPPQPVADWEGVRSADRFGPRCMQPRLYGDQIFRSAGMSEDCLYLNVWTPEASSTADLPVLVYFYGGGFVTGDGSEPRYDGASMAEEGIVVVTMNYRLGVFGFMAHPELTTESSRNASGNYGLLDQARALQWVQENIDAFGGDPDRVTIAGESAGSISVSAHMASPVSAGRFQGAIGESGALLGTLPPGPLGPAEERGAEFADQVGAGSLEELRAISSTRLHELAQKPDVPRFGLTVDGHFFDRAPDEVYAAGEQADVPLLLGWNSEEMNYGAILQGRAPTPQNYEQAVRELYQDDADEILEHYEAATWEEVIQAGTDLASDRFIGFGTWKWGELHRRTGAPTFRYFYTRARPPMRPGRGNDVRGLVGASDGGSRVSPPRGAVHAAEIEYALGNLETNDIYAWTAADRQTSAHVKGYFADFIKSGSPNGSGRPEWPEMGTEDPPTIMRLNARPEAVPAPHRDRYLLLDRISSE